MLAETQQRGAITENTEKEKERLKLKKTRVLKQHREGYIDDEEFQGELAAVELALCALDMPEVGGVRLDEVIETGEHIPGMAALWDVGTPDERIEMIMLILEPEGLCYDTELKMIAVLKPRPNFLPILRMLTGIVEYKETSGLLVTAHWCERNRRVSVTLSPTLTLFLPPHGKLYLILQERLKVG
jgi:site-specific DNA recombinase